MYLQRKPSASAKLAIVVIAGLASACSSTAQKDPDPESPEKPAESTSLGANESTIEQPETVTFESCTVTLEQIPQEPIGFADVGNGGFIPGEGDCDRINMYTGPAGDPILNPWNEQTIKLCSLTPVPDIGVTGDYSIHLQLKSEEEITIERDQTAELPEGATVESIRFELGDNLTKPPENGNDYLGKCQVATPEEGSATEIGFNLDITGTSQPEPNRFGPPEE